MSNNNEFFLSEWWRQKCNSKNIYATALTEQFSIKLLSVLRCLNMRLLGYWKINITVFQTKSEPGCCLCNCWLKKYVPHFIVVF